MDEDSVPLTDDPCAEQSAPSSTAVPNRSSSIQPNEKLLSRVRDFSLANRLLHIRIYQVFHSTVDCVGYRVAATDDVENDYALFVSRAKGELLYRAGASAGVENASAEAVASSILVHLDIIGNRHRDIGRLVCREPEAKVNRQTRVVPRPTSQNKVRNAHLPTKEQDKRASRNKQSQQRVQEAIAHSHKHRSDTAADDGSQDLKQNDHDDVVHVTSDSNMHKSRKSSEAGILHRMANAKATTVWRSELEGINDNSVDQGDVDDSESDSSPPGSASYPDPATASPTRLQPQRALPERKTKYPELQKRRDKGRQQRFQVIRPVVARTPPSVNDSPPKKSSPPRHSSSSLSTHHPQSVGKHPMTAACAHVAASATIGNAFALKSFVGDAQPEQEQFLRRKTIRENQNRVFKAEGVFDDTMGVEITDERPDHRFHTPEYAPRSAEITSTKRLSHSKKRNSTASASSLPPNVESLTPSLAGSASAPALASPRPDLSDGESQERACDVGREANQESAVKQIGGIRQEANSAEGDMVDEILLSEGIESRRKGREPPAVSSPTELEIHPGDQDEIAHHTPRSARVREINIVEVESPEEEQDYAASPLESLQTPQPLQEDTATGVLTMEEPTVTPRVECWEEDTEFVPEAIILKDDTTAGQAEDESLDQSANHWALEADLATTDHMDETSAELAGLGQATAGEDTVQDTGDEVATLNVESFKGERDQVEVEDPVVVLELAPNQLQIHSPQSDANMLTQPSSSLTLELPEKSGSSRRRSETDAATNAVAAAAVAASATTTPTSVPPQSSTHIPNSSATRLSSKWRSPNSTATLVAQKEEINPAELRRNDSRRSTVYILPMSDASQEAIVSKISQRSEESTLIAIEIIQKLEMVEPPMSGASQQAIASKISERSEESAAMEITTTEIKQKLERVEAPPPSSASFSSEANLSRPHLHHSKVHHEPLHNQRSQQVNDRPLNSPSYHNKWSQWTNSKQLVDKVTCLQLEEQLLYDPNDATSLAKLGLKYARWPATSLPAVLLLENASVVCDSSAGHTHEYWNSLGNAHFDVFLRHRKFLPIAIFHLDKSIQAFMRAFAYLESVADPLLLLRYTVCLYWKKSDDKSNLERADGIFCELFSKFGSFCDKDRLSLQFLHFQILCRLEMHDQAIRRLTKVIDIHGTSLAQSHPVPPKSHGAPPSYDTADYLLMLTHRQQVSGDVLQASATFSKLLKHRHHLNSEVLMDSSSLTDHDYLHMWGALADKCFQHEDYSLASDFYAIATTYTKDSRVLARVLYHHALCYQALGETVKCRAEFKRAKNLNRRVVPFATLAEIHSRYNAQYTAMLHTPVADIIKDVRSTLYDRAAAALQRLFRRKKHSKIAREHARGADASEPGGLQSRVERRRQSIVATLTNLVEESNTAIRGSVIAEVGGNLQVTDAVDPHKAFLQRHAATLAKLDKLRERPLKKASTVLAVKLNEAPLSGLLSPVEFRPDLRRKHSMDSYHQRLGYMLEGRGQYVDHWEQLVTTSLDLYETRTSFCRRIASIRSVLPLVSESVACCALADAAGDADAATEKLHDAVYEHELQLVTDVIDVASILQRHFHFSTDAIHFPPIKSPSKLSSPVAKEASPMNKQASILKLPTCASPSKMNRKVVRLSSLIDDHFQAAGCSRKVQLENEVGHERFREVDQLEVLDDFRSVNASLLYGWQR